MTPPEPFLAVENLARTFGGVKAVDGLSIELLAGQVVGLIGANGAGKTTTMRILATLDLPDRGNVRLSGVDIEVPASTAAKIVAETTLGSVDVGDGFTKREGAFLTESALAGRTPLLTIRAGVRLGSLKLRAT